MSKSTGYIIGIALTIGIGSILQYFLCCGPGVVANNMNDVSTGITAAGMPFAVEDPDGTFSINLDHNFDFPRSSYSYIKPLDDELEIAIGELKTFLDANNDVSLNINGFAYENEDNLSAFPTLGEARANAVKSGLIDREIAGNQLSVSGFSFDGDSRDADSIVYGPISYALSRSGDMISDTGAEVETAAANDGSDIAKELRGDPLVLYFETGRAYVNLSQQERQLISRLNQYIDQNDQANIKITGHTDDSGSPDTNKRLGKERAEFLKSYLVRNGFQSNRINTVSQGETDPIASNNTADGRAKNRRAVMTIVN